MTEKEKQVARELRLCATLTKVVRASYEADECEIRLRFGNTWVTVFDENKNKKTNTKANKSV